MGDGIKGQGQRVFEGAPDINRAPGVTGIPAADRQCHSDGGPAVRGRQSHHQGERRAADLDPVIQLMFPVEAVRRLRTELNLMHPEGTSVAEFYYENRTTAVGVEPTVTRIVFAGREIYQEKPSVPVPTAGEIRAKFNELGKLIDAVWPATQK
jgi:hypothetical protein